MRMRGDLHFDAVVIGAGTAGLTAATRLADGGARVCVLAKGVGSTHLAPATIDVLGYAPDRVEHPGEALNDLIASRPEHPYALIGADAVAGALQWFSGAVAGGPLPGYRYVGDLKRNHLIPTAVGVLRPSALVPETMAGADAAGNSLGRVCVVGSRLLRDFHAGLCAANLAKSGIDARPVEIALESDRADQNALGLARRFDDPAWRAAFCADLALALGSDDRVALPAILGISDPHGVWSDLEQRLGMRLFEILRSALRRAGGRLVLGSEVVGCEREGDRLSALHAHAAGSDVRYVARWVVLATGGFASGAIELDSQWATHERVLGLALRGVPAAGEPRFVGTYLEEQPMARVGVAVDSELRAEATENVLVAGAALPGAAAWREGCGEGIALASGYLVADTVLASAGGAATPSVQGGSAEHGPAERGPAEATA